ncbi:MAG TPA: TIGR03435 family protein [Bryobacteraceae bacterium]|jgi:uncharacterized protein (TIGR03435 family)
MRRAITAASVLALTVYGLQGQPVQPPAFEVVSIKISQEPEGSAGWNSSPAGSLRMRNQSLRSLIRIAYGVKESQISGGPKWLGSTRFHVDAKAPAPANDSQLLLMLQGLLADRFRLTLHRETRNTTGYALVVGTGGLKIRPSPPGPSNRLNSHSGHAVADGVSMAKLAEMLSSQVQVPVVDETGAGGVYSFTLDWTPEPAPGAPAVAEPPGSPPLLTALQEQLGLKLAPRKLPLEMLVIDSAEKPAEN